MSTSKALKSSTSAQISSRVGVNGTVKTKKTAPISTSVSASVPRPVMIQLLRVRPTPELLALDAGVAVAKLVSQLTLANEPANTTLLSNLTTLLSRAERSQTTGSPGVTARDLFDLLDLKTKENRAFLTRFFHVFLETSPVLWPALQKEAQGLRLSPAVVRASEKIAFPSPRQQSIASALFATLSASTRASDGVLCFNVELNHHLFFEPVIPLSDVAAGLHALKNHMGYGLPVVDSYRRRPARLLGLTTIDLNADCPWENKKSEKRSWSSFFVATGRFTSQDMQERISRARALHQEPLMAAGACVHNAFNKHYSYPFEHLHLAASTALQGLATRSPVSKDKVWNKIAKLCSLGFESIREDMAQKEILFSGALTQWARWFEAVPAQLALMTTRDAQESQGLKGTELHNQRHDHFHVTKNFTDSAQRTLFSKKQVLLLPISKTPVDAKLDLSAKKYFLNKGGQFVKCGGYSFQPQRYDPKDTQSNPLAIVNAVLQHTGPGGNVLMGWRGASLHQLANNALMDFEFSRHGCAVQHFYDQGQSGNAYKVGNLLQGTYQKFDIPKKAQPPLPYFDLCMGLDISRSGRLNVPGFPVCVNADGEAFLAMPDKLDVVAKEKRPEQELIDMIQLAVAALPASSVPLRVLFLRDGYAPEDFLAIQAALPGIELTVLSVRKNALFGHSPSFSSGCLESVGIELDNDCFAFGTVARQGDGRLGRLHVVEPVLTPSSLKLPWTFFLDVLLSLCEQNITTELGLASLPFPLHYADRFAGTVRALMNDSALQQYIVKTHANQLQPDETPEDYIYRVIRDYVRTHPYGYAFAV